MALTKEQFLALRAKGLSNEQIIKFESGEKPAATPASPAKPRMSLDFGPFGMTRVPELAASPVGRAVTGSLPAIGGAGGGAVSVLAGPFAPYVAPATAATGSLIGSTAQSLIQGQPMNLQEAAKQAKYQAAFEGLGTLGSSAVRGLGKGAMRMALRPSRAVTKAAPEIVDQALQQGATVMPVGPKVLPKVMRGGMPQAEAVRGARAAVTDKALATADAAGPPLPGGLKGKYQVRMSSILPSPKDVVPGSASRVLDQRIEAKAAIDDIIRNHPTPKTLTELRDMKRTLWDEAKAIVEKTFPGKNTAKVIAQAPIEARVKYAAAQNIQKLLAKVPNTGVPGGLGASEAATAKSIDVAKAVGDAENAARSGVSPFIPQTLGRGGATATGAFLGAEASPEHRTQGAIEGGLTGALMTHPAVASRLAHVLNNPALLMALRQSPRLAALYFGTASPDTLKQ